MLSRITTLGLLLSRGSLSSQGDAGFIRSEYLRNDTAQAIISLYNKRPAGSAGWMISGLLVDARAVSSGGSSTTVTG